MIRATGICAAAATLALAAALPAQATASETKQVSVSYSDLDLSTEDGRVALERRIEQAAQEMCGMDGRLTTGSRMPTYSMRWSPAGVGGLGEGARHGQRGEDEGETAKRTHG